MEKVLSKIVELYGLKLKIENRVTEGFQTENHILTDGNQKYFLKKYTFEDPKRVKEIHVVKKYFSDGGIPVVLPLKTKNEETFFDIDNAYYALFPFVTGKQFERGKLPETAGYSFARVLAQLHLLGKRPDAPRIEETFTPFNKTKKLDLNAIIEQKIKEKTSLDDFDRLALESLELKKRLISENLITYEELNLPSDHLIHGDYLEQNVFFDEHDTVSYVFDFEKSRYAPRVFELFRAMIYSVLGTDTSPANIAKLKNCIDVYLEIYQMSKDEIKRGLVFFYLKEIHNIWVEREHYLKDNNRTDVFLAQGLARIKYLSENLDNLTKVLIS